MVVMGAIAFIQVVLLLAQCTILRTMVYKRRARIAITQLDKDRLIAGMTKQYREALEAEFNRETCSV